MLCTSPFFGRSFTFTSLKGSPSLPLMIIISLKLETNGSLKMSHKKILIYMTSFFPAAPAPAPDFFPKQLRLLVFFSGNSCSGSAPDYWLSLAKYSFHCKLVR